MKFNWLLALTILLLSAAIAVACGTVSSGGDDDEDDDDDQQVDDDDDDEADDDDDDEDDDDDDEGDDDDDDTGDDDDDDTGPPPVYRKLSDFDGQVRVLNTMAAWCGGCQQETSLLQTDLWDEYHEDGFEVLQLMAENYGGSTPNVAFLQWWRNEKYDLEYILLIDPYWQIGAQFNDSDFYIPYNAILDQNGVCVHKQVGYDKNIYVAIIDDLLKNPPSPGSEPEGWGVGEKFPDFTLGGDPWPEP